MRAAARAQVTQIRSRANVRQSAPGSCSLRGGSYLFGLSALAPCAASRRAFRPMSATLAKLREPGGRKYLPPYTVFFHEYSAVTKLYVGNLPFTATDEGVRDFFPSTDGGESLFDQRPRDRPPTRLRFRRDVERRRFPGDAGAQRRRLRGPPSKSERSAGAANGPAAVAATAAVARVGTDASAIRRRSRLSMAGSGKLTFAMASDLP